MNPACIFLLLTLKAVAATLPWCELLKQPQTALPEAIPQQPSPLHRPACNWGVKPLPEHLEGGLQVGDCPFSAAKRWQDRSRSADLHPPGLPPLQAAGGPSAALPRILGATGSCRELLGVAGSCSSLPEPGGDFASQRPVRGRPGPGPAASPGLRRAARGGPGAGGAEGRAGSGCPGPGGHGGG